MSDIRLNSIITLYKSGGRVGIGVGKCVPKCTCVNARVYVCLCAPDCLVTSLSCQRNHHEKDSGNKLSNPTSLVTPPLYPSNWHLLGTTLMYKHTHAASFFIRKLN